MLFLNRKNALSNGLILDIPFIEAGGTTVRDTVKKKTGTTTNTPTRTIDYYGRALTFASGSSQYVQLNSPTDLVLNRNFTIAALLYKSSAGASPGMGILSYGNQGYFLRINNTSEKLEFLESQIASILTGNTRLESGIWAAVGVTVSAESTATVKLYLDGQLDGSTTTTATFNTATQSLKIGTDTDNVGGLSDYLDGKLMYVRVWNRALTPQEMASLYRNPWQIYRRWPESPYLYSGNTKAFASTSHLFALLGMGG